MCRVKVLAGFNDLVTKYPDLEKQADGWGPTTVRPGSHQILAWRYPVGHSWDDQVKSRALNCFKNESIDLVLQF